MSTTGVTEATPCAECRPGPSGDDADHVSPAASATSTAEDGDGRAVTIEDPMLTKAKLFTVAGEDGSWTEIGVGTVSIRTDNEEEVSIATTVPADAPATTTTTSPSARMDVVSIEEDTEVLMSTPLVEDDIYVVQHGTILVWSDPEIGRDMALSFNTAEGCRATTDAILAYQVACRQSKRRLSTGNGTSAAVGDAQDTTPDALRQASALSSEGAEDQMSPWSVCRANLPTIALALQNNVKRFGLHIRDSDRYASQLTALFKRCASEGDCAGMDHIGRIVVVLLGPPFNTDGRILSQFIDNDVIDDTLDVVQYALGRRSAETGYVDTTTRRSTFRNPCHLPPHVVTKIHVLHAAQSLKDLVPLLLDEGDAAGNSLLAVFLLRFKFGLVSDILRHDSCLPHAFTSEETHQSLDTMRTFVAFLHDLSKTIKNAMVPFDTKEGLYEEMFSCGVLEYARRALTLLIATPSSLPEGAERCGEHPAPLPHMIVSMLCDIIAHMIMFFPKVRDALHEDATSAAAADSSDVRRCLWQRANFCKAPSAPGPPLGSEQHTAGSPSVLFTALTTNDNHRKCLLDVMMDVAAWASLSGVSMVAQSAYDVVYSCCVGLLQGNVYMAVGHNIQPRRRQVVRYLAEGCDCRAPTSPTNANGIVAAPLVALCGTDDAGYLLQDTPPEAAVGTDNTEAPQTMENGGSSSAPVAVDANAPPPLHPDWPPLYRVLFAVGNLSTVSTGCDGWAPSHADRVALHYLVRLLLPLTKDPIVFTSPGLSTMLEASKALRTVRAMLEVRSPHAPPRAHPVPSSSAHGSAANVQATLMSWVSELVVPGEASINAALVHSGVLLPIVDWYIALHGRRRGGGCILGSAAAHCLQAVHSSIHQLKGGVRPSAASSPLLQSMSPTCAQRGKGTNPFLRSIGKDDGLDASRTRSLGPLRSAPEPAVDVSIVQHILTERGDNLRASTCPAHMRLVAQLEHVIVETPEEASEDLSSREASSVAAVVMSDLDFNTLLGEYGPDAPVPDTVLRDVVGNDVSSPHHHHGNRHGHDSVDGDNSDACVASTCSDEEEDEERVGFLLRRESTVRAKRMRSPGGSSASVSDDDDDEADNGEAGTERSPSAKTARKD